VDVPDILEMLEGFIARVMKEVKGVEVALPLPRLTYNEAIALYGSDKPDTRYDMEICDISELIGSFAAKADLQTFISAGIVAKGAAGSLTRKEIDKLSEFAKGIGGKSLAFIRWTSDADAPSCSFGKFMGEGDLEQLCVAMGCERGDCALITNDNAILGAVRKQVAEKLDLIPHDVFNYVWITDMPFFLEEDGAFVAMHHPFTCPTDDSMAFIESDKSKVYAKAYDLVINGVELLSGSIRITDHELQSKMFAALGLTDEEIAAKFGFLVEAYKYGAPPHGGAGIGLDRLAMVLCGADSLRDVTAFPKVKDASELMSDCRAEVDEVQLNELGISFKK
jgi:aspartyl-tRNA synthetase